MAPLQPKSETLGQIHRRFNKLINETSYHQAHEITELNYDDSDLDNLLKIEIACKYRNVDYILKVFESDDMLYVSRAIKRSTWLITEQQYSHIINATYIHKNLQPKMNATGFKKLILHIRLNLKDESCAEGFFNYYKEKDLTEALKWLPLCSIKFVEDILYNYAQKIPARDLVRLCKKSFNSFAIYLSIQNTDAGSTDTVLNSTTFLLKRHTEAYLDIVERYSYPTPKFGVKLTRFILMKCPERVKAKLENYCKILDLPTFAEFIEPKEIKNFILANIKNKHMSSWFTQNNIGYFIKRLPKKARFKFIKDLFIDKKYKDIPADALTHRVGYSRLNESSLRNVYMWYKYAPFETAFTDLRKLIRSESKPQERTAMFEVLLKCAVNNADDLKTLLKYYRESHINEPVKFKMQFVNEVVRHANTHRFDKETWGFLNDLFSSMDVYREGKNVDQIYVRAIVQYNVLHDENIPDIMNQKFQFCTVKMFEGKLSDDDKEKMFRYLYNTLITKIENLDIIEKTEFNKAFILWKNVLQLLLDSNKELQDFPIVINKVKEMILLNEKNNERESLEKLLDFKNSWRKLFFDESILLKATQATCINALKHGPELIEKHKNIVEAMCLDDERAKNQFLKKLRIYWPQSLAHYYKELFINKLDQPNLHKSTLLGLCCMLPKREISDLVERYAPVKKKVDWSHPDDIDFSIRKHLAMNLFLARPQPSATLALLYAKGDYLQYILPSLMSILHKTNADKIREYIPILLNAPVSLQKHGIRIAFAKLRHDEIKQFYSDIWKSAKNSSIRADIFCQTFNCICSEKNEIVIREMWQLLNIIIDDLKADENKIIYTKMSKVENVPMLIRPEYWMKSYKFLKSLPQQANCEGLVDRLINNMFDILHLMDNDFLADMFLESIDEKIFTNRYEYANLLPVCLLSTKSEEVHLDRCKKILIPLLERALPMWDKAHKGSHYAQLNLQDILSNMDQQFQRVVLIQKMFVPVPLYAEVYRMMSQKLPIEENYCTITERKLALEFVKIFDKVCESNKGLKAVRMSPGLGDSSLWEPLYDEAAPQFGQVSAQCLKEDVYNYSPSIYLLFGEAFNDVFGSYGFNTLNKLRTLKSFIEWEEESYFYLFVLNLLNSCYAYNDLEVHMKSDILEEVSSHNSREVQMQYWLLRKKLNRASIF